MNIRSLQSNDYYLNYINLLNQLSIIDDTKISYNKFEIFIQNLTKKHIIKVIEINNQIVATGTLYIEQKIIHEFGHVGHIEDIVVDSNFRGMRLGKKIVCHLINLAKEKGCYKVILNCNENNVRFYEKCGLIRKECEMVKYF